MPTYINPQAWSTTAASNDGADSGFGVIANTSYPRPVLDWYRGDMAALKRFVGDTGGALVAGGSANALTVTTNQNLSAAHVAAGLCLVVRAAEANTSATVTFSPDGLTAAAIKSADGSALSIGQIKAGMPLLLFYNAGSSEWRAANLVVSASGDLGSTTASFLATKSGGDQIIGSTAAKVTFPVAVFNNGLLYSEADSRWTPAAGKVRIKISVLVLAVEDNESAIVYLYKNSVAYKKATVTQGNSATTPDISATIAIVDAASGMDTYEVYAQRDLQPNSAVSGATTKTWFCGTMI